MLHGCHYRFLFLSYCEKCPCLPALASWPFSSIPIIFLSPWHIEADFNSFYKEETKAMIRNRYYWIPHPALNTKMERDTYNKDDNKIKTAKVKSQGDSSFPTDGHKAILNKLNSKSKTNRKRTNIDNWNKPQQKHRLGTVSNKLLGGLNRFYVAAISPCKIYCLSILPYKSIMGKFDLAIKKVMVLSESLFEQFCRAWGFHPVYQVWRSLACWFQRRRFLKGFYHIWAWLPSWLYDKGPFEQPNLFFQPLKALHGVTLNTTNHHKPHHKPPQIQKQIITNTLKTYIYTQHF